MLFFVIKPHKWQLAPESITSPPLTAVHTVPHQRNVRACAYAGCGRCEQKLKKLTNRKLRHCLNNDGVIITHENNHDRDASFKL